MSAYSGESALARVLAPTTATRRTRALLHEAFTTTGILEVVADRLEVRLNPLSAFRHTRSWSPSATSSTRPIPDTCGFSGKSARHSR
ncbi:MAG: hypothetical protein ACYDEA_10655 [Candidatus Dormibacteria bacterium]